jgi:uncharacterized glyoxalase superfamily protein PhnB
MKDTTFTTSLVYRDPKAAIDWLGKAFDLELTMAIEGPGSQCHYEMAYQGHGRLVIGSEWNEWMRSPASGDGRVTSAVSVAVPDDIDAHCERARAAGARISAEPSDQFYGDRTYRCIDPEGHHWTFAMHVRDVTRAEAEAAVGTTIYSPGWE